MQCETAMVNTSWFATAVVLLLNRKRLLKQDVWEKSRFVLSSVAKSVEFLGGILTDNARSAVRNRTVSITGSLYRWLTCIVAATTRAA